VQPDAHLPEVVEATRAPGRFAGRLNCRQQKCSQDADDRDDHQQLNERKPAQYHPR